MKGKIKIAISSSLSILLIVAIAVICVFFAPRALRNDVVNQGAISVKFISNHDDGVEVLLDGQQLQDFWKQVDKAKYSPKYDKIKGVSDFDVSIEYEDGKKIVFSQYKIKKYSSDGTLYQTKDMILKMDIFDEYGDMFRK